MQHTLIRDWLPTRDAFIFTFDSEEQARSYFACDARSALKTLTQWHCNTAVARIAGQEDIRIPIATIRLMTEFKPLVELFFADVSLPPIVLKQAITKSEAEGRWGIVRMRQGDESRQVIMSSAMQGVLLPTVAIADTTKDWTREATWHPEDLANFNRDWRRQLSIEDNNEIEYRYRIRKPRSPNDPWVYYRSSFRLMEAGNDLFHVCSFIDRG